MEDKLPGSEGYEEDEDFPTEVMDDLADAPIPTPASTCSQCDKPLVGDERFCLYCGVPTGAAESESISCQVCGERIPTNALFCGACGAGIRAGRQETPPSASRSFPLIPDQPEQRQVWQRGIWLGAGTCLTAFLLLGIGLAIGTNIRSERVVVVTEPEKPKPDLQQPQAVSPLVSPLPPGRHMIIAAEPVSVYKKPSHDAEVLGKASPGKTVVVVRSQGGWVQILSPSGDAGYVPSQAVSPELVAEEEFEAAPQGRPSLYYEQIEPSLGADRQAEI